jgi:hypothetical protein
LIALLSSLADNSANIRFNLGNATAMPVLRKTTTHFDADLMPSEAQTWPNSGHFLPLFPARLAKPD